MIATDLDLALRPDTTDAGTKHGHSVKTWRSVSTLLAVAATATAACGSAETPDSSVDSSSTSGTDARVIASDVAKPDKKGRFGRRCYTGEKVRGKFVPYTLKGARWELCFSLKRGAGGDAGRVISVVSVKQVGKASRSAKVGIANYPGVTGIRKLSKKTFKNVLVPRPLPVLTTTASVDCRDITTSRRGRIRATGKVIIRPKNEIGTQITELYSRAVSTGKLCGSR